MIYGGAYRKICTKDSMYIYLRSYVPIVGLELLESEYYLYLRPIQSRLTVRYPIPQVSDNDLRLECEYYT